MATAWKCDVCGALFEREIVPDVRVVVYIHGYGDDVRKDLCPKCQQELEDWLSQRKDKKDE